MSSTLIRFGLTGIRVTQPDTHPLILTHERNTKQHIKQKQQHNTHTDTHINFTDLCGDYSKHIQTHTLTTVGV